MKKVRRDPPGVSDSTGDNPSFRAFRPKQILGRPAIVPSFLIPGLAHPKRCIYAPIDEEVVMATYAEIQKVVRAKHGFVPKTCWIAHVKSDFSLTNRTAPNRIHSAKAMLSIA